MDQLNSLPYLDAVVKEGLRVHSAFGGSMRMATKDDLIPVEKPYVDRYGVTRDHIALVQDSSLPSFPLSHSSSSLYAPLIQGTSRVSKGDTAFIPIYYLNTSKDIWGQDAKVFK
jgi:hypothetical protein